MIELKETTITLLTITIWLLGFLLLWSAIKTWSAILIHASHRDSPFRISRNVLGVFFRETVVRALFVLITPLGWLFRRPSARTSSVGKGHVPVLIVVGPSIQRAAALFLVAFLRSRDWHWLWTIRSSRGTIADQANVLERHVGSFIRHTQSKQIDIVAHGCSGLAVAWFLRHSDMNTRVRRFITLGTPWQGTRTALFGALRRNAPELTPHAPTLDQFQDLPTPTVSIWSPDDTTVIPANSAAPEWLKTVRIEGTGHFELLTSPRALRAIQTALESPLESR